jgi:hypothetical protein
LLFFGIGICDGAVVEIIARGAPAAPAASGAFSALCLDFLSGADRGFMGWLAEDVRDGLFRV